MKTFDNRADAEVVGHVIILGITILGVSMIALYGIPAISGLQDMANLKNTEQGFTVLDSRASRSALGEAPRQIIDIALGGGYISTIPNSSSEPSYILVEVKNSTSTISSISIPMGKIVYRLGEREVAYEGGGVWSKYPSATVMLSPPEFHYNGETLTLPVVNISGNYSMGGKGTAALNIQKNGTPLVMYPNASYASYMNPIPENASYVNITINSTYYDGWASYFRSIPLTNIYSDGTKKKVTVKLQNPPSGTNYSYGLLSSEEISLENQATIDSYNSSGNRNYSQTRSGNGSIRANNKIDLRNPQATVNGSALSGGNIQGRGTIKKDAYGSPISGTLTVLGTKNPAVAKISVLSATELVNGKINDTKAQLPNAMDCLSGAYDQNLDEDNFASNKCTISAGDYYVTRVELDAAKDLIFDTTSGPVNMAVDSDDITISNNANISVNGNYPVNLYFSLSSSKELEIKNVKINNYTNDNSTLFQVIVSGGKKISFKGANFCGSVYAPDAAVEVDTDTKIYGALTGKTFKIKNAQSIHFDQALKDANVGIGEATTIMYLYITRNDLGVSIG